MTKTIMNKTCGHFDCIQDRMRKQGLEYPVPFPARIGECHRYGRTCRECGYEFCPGSVHRPDNRGMCGYCRVGVDMPIVSPGNDNHQQRRRRDDTEIPF